MAEAENDPPLWLRLILGRNPRRTFLRIGFWIIISYVLFKFIFALIQVKGNSMYPTFRDGTIHLVNKLAYLRSEPKRGDVVAVEWTGPDLLILKRVIAGPGETVFARMGKLYVNGELYEIPEVKSLLPRGPRASNPVILGENEYYLAGDNREITELFTKRKSQIVGKVVF